MGARKLSKAVKTARIWQGSLVSLPSLSLLSVAASATACCNVHEFTLHVCCCAPCRPPASTFFQPASGSQVWAKMLSSTFWATLTLWPCQAMGRTGVATNLSVRALLYCTLNEKGGLYLLPVLFQHALREASAFRFECCFKPETHAQDMIHSGLTSLCSLAASCNN